MSDGIDPDPGHIGCFGAIVGAILVLGLFAQGQWVASFICLAFTIAVSAWALMRSAHLSALRKHDREQ